MIKSNRLNTYLKWINPVNTKKVIITALNKYCLINKITDLDSYFTEDREFIEDVKRFVDNIISLTPKTQ